jgi:hypothetical protein
MDEEKVFVLKTDAGRLEVRTDRAPWSTTPFGGGRGKRAVGWDVLLVGRIERIGKRGSDGEVVRVSYSGPDSLMFFATESERDAEVEVRRYLARRRNTYLFMLALAFVQLAASLWFIGHLPPSK